MWGVQLYLFWLITNIHSSHTSQDLRCHNDFINNVTCVWNSTCTGQDVCAGANTTCTLNGTLIAHRSAYFRSATCKMTIYDVSEPKMRKCSLNYQQNSSRKELGHQKRIQLEVKCENRILSKLSGFEPANHVKLYPPGKPVVDQTNISWTLGSPHCTFIKEYHYQLQYRQAEQPWQEHNFSDGRTNFELDRNLQVVGVQYSVRLRSKPAMVPSYWSDWSPITTWTSTEDDQDWRFVLGVPIGILGLSISLLVIVLKSQRMKHLFLKSSYIPDPSKYFYGLDSVHEGNVKSWLGSVIIPGDLTCTFIEDISPVEVHRVLGTSSPLLKRLSCGGPTEALDCSGQSTNISNSIYFLSQSSRFAGETLKQCPANSPYQPAGGDKGPGNGDNLCDDLGRLELSSASIRVVHPRAEVQSPDSGFAASSDTQESQGDFDEEEEDLFLSPASPPVLNHALPAGTQLPRPTFSPPGPLHSFPDTPFPFPGFMMDLAGDKSSFGILPGHAFLGLTVGSIEPSDDVYMAVKDLKKPERT